MAFDFPNAPTTNQIVTMPDGTVRKWDGVKWVAGQTPTAPYCYTGDTPPSNPTPGASWWDSVSCQLFVYYNDGNSSQWVPAVAIPASVGEAPSNSNYYARRNGQWSDIGTSQLQGNVGRNFVHNSTFSVNQRGTGPFSIGVGSAYTSDRWIASCIAAGDSNSISVAAVSDGNRYAIGDESASVMLLNSFTGGAGAGNGILLTQYIEGVRRLANKTVTVSFWATAGTALKLGVSFNQFFGGGGSPSATVLLDGQSVTLSSSAFARYTLTFVLPSIAGKTLGTAGNDCTHLTFWLSAGSSYAVRSGNTPIQSGAIWLWGVQLEIGSVATQFEKIPYEDDLRHCQRFFYTTAQNAMASGYHPNAASLSVFGTILFSIYMRATPTASVAFSGINNNAISALQTTPFGYTFSATNAAGGAFQIQTTGTSAFSADL